MDPDLPTSVQVDVDLVVVETHDAVLAVRSDDHDDWLARFDKSDGFPARQWAENMVRVFNRRRAHQR